MVKNLFRKYLNEYIENQSFLVYHGSPHKISTFKDEFVGSPDAVDSEGPGIYMTNIYNDARQYGDNIYTLKITPRKLLDQTPTEKIKYNIHPILSKLIKMNSDWKETAQNWDENYSLGLQKAITDFIKYNYTEKDIFLQVWFDFYRHSEIEFIRNMVKLGIDGIVIDKKDFEHLDGFKNCKHFIIYNPSIIQVRDIEYNQN